MGETHGSRCLRSATVLVCSKEINASENHRFCNVEPTAEPPKDEPTEVSCMLEPTFEELMLELMVESDILDPTVDC